MRESDTKRIQLIKESISENNLRKATNETMDLANDLDSSAGTNFKKTSIVLKRRYQEILTQTIQNTESPEYLSRETNKLSSHILAFLTEIETEISSGFSQRTSDGASRVSGLEALEKKRNQVSSEEQSEDPFVCVGNQLSKSYPGNHAFKLNKISLKLKAKEITGLAGKNAAGKTTLIKMVAGILAPDFGSLVYPMIMKGEKNSWYRIKRAIGYMPQNLVPWKGFMGDNLHATLAMQGIKGKENRILVEWISERLSLSDYLEYQWSDLSGGYKTRFTLAKLLLFKPKLLVLDEPLANLDPLTVQHFLDDLKQLIQSREFQASVLLSSQNIEEIERVCNDMIFLNDGNIFFTGPIQHIQKEHTSMVYEFVFDSPISEMKLTGLPYEKLEKSSDNLIMRMTFPAWVQSGFILKEMLERELHFNRYAELTSSTKRFF